MACRLRRCDKLRLVPAPSRRVPAGRGVFVVEVERLVSQGTGSPVGCEPAGCARRSTSYTAPPYYSRVPCSAGHRGYPISCATGYSYIRQEIPGGVRIRWASSGGLTCLGECAFQPDHGPAHWREGIPHCRILAILSVILGRRLLEHAKLPRSERDHRARRCRFPARPQLNRLIDCWSSFLRGMPAACQSVSPRQRNLLAASESAFPFRHLFGPSLRRSGRD